VTIRYSRRFIKQLARQPAHIQTTFYKRLKIFELNPYDPVLRNHVLKGRLKGLYSIDITGDVRAIYEVVDDEVYLYQLIGTHSQLYG
jgi:addiction module RelE/StbE family toxin